MIISNITVMMFMATAAYNNYNSWYSHEIANNVMDYALVDEYHPHLDYNGDEKLSVIDAVCIEKRRVLNEEYGTLVTFNEEDVYEIISENWLEEPIYYEIDFIENTACREYEIAVQEPIKIHVYVEFGSFSDGFYCTINPWEEIYTVE